ncbi:MAG: hypothetical protein ACSLEW_01495 [Nocardioides sp.]
MLKLLAVVALFAVATYLLIRVIERRSELMGNHNSAPRPARPKPRPTRPVAPDDDEDFLRDLDRKRLNPEDPQDPQ